MSFKKEEPYKSDFLNEHLGDLKFGYTTFHIVRIENVNAKSKKDKYTDIKVYRVVNYSGEKYEIEEWKSLVESKVKELKEEFILEELVKRQEGLPFNIHEKKEDIYFDALKSFTYRIWERAVDSKDYFLSEESRKNWLDFNLMLEAKYPEQMQNRLINQIN